MAGGRIGTTSCSGGGLHVHFDASNETVIWEIGRVKSTQIQHIRCTAPDVSRFSDKQILSVRGCSNSSTIIRTSYGRGKCHNSTSGPICTGTRAIQLFQGRSCYRSLIKLTSKLSYWRTRASYEVDLKAHVNGIPTSWQRLGCSLSL